MKKSLIVMLMCAGTALAQNAGDPDLNKPTLFVVGYAHLDTQWRWEYPQVIREFLPNTMHDNFSLFEKYPHYIFNFSGANRYRLMKEYYPADYARLTAYVKAGRWFPAGSSMEEGDVNSPSAESILRQVLYGNQFFRHDFAKASAEYMLPDCFGFPASLPSLLAHAGIKGFSTQKLTWHSASSVGGPDSQEKTPLGIPFNLGFWQGPDGRGVIAALNPGDYSGGVSNDLSKSDPAGNSRNFVDWPRRIDLDGKVSGLFTDYHYYGTGDVGGAPRESSVRLMEAIVTRSKTVMPRLPSPGQHEEDNSERADAAGAQHGPDPVQVGDGPVRVISANAEQMFLTIKPEQIAGLPRYSGDLELIEHSAGSLTSESYQKRWNRKNELLADAAERASVAAAWLGGRSYPQERLNNAWTLVMGGQFHDIMAGTATPQAYEYSWNDDVLAMNQFAQVLTSATDAVSSALDTQASGVALVVYNPLNIERSDVVEATVTFPKGAPKFVRVFGPLGEEVPAQWQTIGDATKVLFPASAPAVGYAVYDLQAAEVSPITSDLKITHDSSQAQWTLENIRYRVRVNDSGDVAGIFDKSLDKELLSAPLRLAFQTEKPHDWPAWNMDWADQQQPPRGYVSGPAKIRVVEEGPVRVALEVERESEGSKFVQTIRLSAGDGGNRVEFANAIDWKTSAAALKATFPFAAANPLATYNWDVGTVQRGNNDPRKYEVASHQWFDLTDKSGTFGVTVLSDCKNGSDKPDDNTLRLTLIYTPGLGAGNGHDYSDQTTQDWGHHEFIYGLAAHAGDWRSGQTEWQALRLNQPLIAFTAAKHPGVLGKSFSLLKTNNNRVRVLALKKAEQSDEIILRVVEMEGKSQQDVHFALAAPVTAVREVNGQEMPFDISESKATISAGELATSFGPYELRTFALKLGLAPAKAAARQAQPVPLPYDLSVASADGTKSSSGFDAEGRALPAEMLPSSIDYAGIKFKLAPAGKPNAIAAKGQSIALPVGSFNRIYLLAASTSGDQQATFRTGGKATQLTIQDWGGVIGQWDKRTWNKHQVALPPRQGAAPDAPPRTRTVLEYTGLEPAFIKRAPVAWFASHRHNAKGENEPYAYCYLFAYELNLPAGTKTLALPVNDKIRILAVSVARESGRTDPAQPLYDTLERPPEK
ncbi:MAG TPA: glycoside hydrolase family 38 C-terminal domain-containing protein [Candidatus Angelobacter sp.]